jgi:acetyl-CoA carboxylase carboxyltransferase component
VKPSITKPFGATTHCEISGVTDYKAKDDKDALDKKKISLIRLGTTTHGFSRVKAKPALDEKNYTESFQSP